MGDFPTRVGWPENLLILDPMWMDFPTRVGMARFGVGFSGLHRRFPHPRGDGP